MALLTSNAELITDINKVFAVLEGKLAGPTFRHLLVARFNMVPELTRMIHREIEHVKAGRKGRIVLKMNGLHDQNMINELYNASENGVEIDLIVRGICCLVPNRPFSANIKVTRIVDMFLEHSRIWYFYNDGEEELFLTSADWMRRNLNRRIETAFPILNAEIKRNIIDILNIQLQDNVKACLIDEHLHNNFKRDGNPVKVRAQLAVYEYLKTKYRRYGSSFPWTFVLFTLCFVALIAGALLGFAVGFRTGGRQERFRLVKEKLKRNKAAICRWQKERYEYARQVKQLEEDLLHSASESEYYKERMSDLEFYQQKLRESERIISSLSVENECQSDSLSMLVQLKEDPLRTNLTREEWNGLFHLTDILFHHVLSDLKEKRGITRHEQEICCLVKWNFSRKEQLAVFNNTSEALTKSKNRLKKKLRLDEKVDLDQFIRLY